MGILDKWIKTKIEEVLRTKAMDVSQLREKILEAHRELDLKISTTQSHIDEAEHEFTSFLSKISEAVSVKENIETIMHAHDTDISKMFYQISEDTLTKTRQFNKDADMWKDEMIPFQISPNQDFKYYVPNDRAMSLLAIKFLSDDGYGKYAIIVNGVERSFFVKREKGNEDGAIFGTRIVFLRPSDVVKVQQTYGAGRLECALYVVLAGSRKTLLS